MTNYNIEPTRARRKWKQRQIIQWVFAIMLVLGVSSCVVTDLNDRLEKLERNSGYPVEMQSDTIKRGDSTIIIQNFYIKQKRR